jgi:hypothetical protein
MSEEIEVCSISKNFIRSSQIELGEVEAGTLLEVKLTVEQGYASFMILLDNERLANIDIVRAGETIPLKRKIPRQGKVSIKIVDVGGIADPVVSGRISISCKEIKEGVKREKTEVEKTQ